MRILNHFLRYAASTSRMAMGELGLLVLLLSASGLRAQETELDSPGLDSLHEEVDSVRLDEQRMVGVNRPGDAAPADTVVIKMVAPEHSPRKAALYSAALPGLGQIYNKKYWKVPIIYGGFMIMGYLVVWNNDQYQVFKRDNIAVRNKLPEESPFASVGGSPITNSEQAVERFHRERDYTIILTAALYGLNIMDAIVDAHLIEFDVNPDLSFNLEPTAGSRMAYDHPVPSLPYAGVAFTIDIK